MLNPMTIQLPREAEQLIKQQMATGHFANEGEVVTQALHLWQKYQKQIADIRASVQRGMDDIEAGRYTKITNTEEANALAENIKRRGRELKAKREASSQ
jgi:putative addiction module CopG family antidote